MKRRRSDSPPPLLHTFPFWALLFADAGRLTPLGRGGTIRYTYTVSTLSTGFTVVGLARIASNMILLVLGKHLVKDSIIQCSNGGYFMVSAENEEKGV